MKIMICGRKGTGKDSAAAFLKQRYGGEIINFAGPLYQMMYACQSILDVEKNKDRLFLTTVGDHFRTINPNIFVEICMDKAYAIDRAKQNVFVSDSRYENELIAGLNEGCFLIELKATDKIRKLRRPNEDPETENHSSENGYKEGFPFNVIINNNGTLEELYERLEEVVADIIKQEKHVIY